MGVQIVVTETKQVNLFPSSCVFICVLLLFFALCAVLHTGGGDQAEGDGYHQGEDTKDPRRRCKGYSHNQGAAHQYLHYIFLSVINFLSIHHYLYYIHVI
jgi:hypothetical protein